MTNEQILKKVIEKAEKNGYYHKHYSTTEFEDIQKREWNDIIFSHDFAKAFWGEEEVNNNGETHDDWLRADDYGWISSGVKKYLYHLQQMVLEKEPLLYIGKFLDD